MLLQQTLGLVATMMVLACAARPSAAEPAAGPASKTAATRASHQPQDNASKKTLLTTIRVDDVHCRSCAKRLARKLFTVPGVKKVQASVKNDLAIVTPQSKKPVCPLKLWEAAEAAKFKVIKIVAPSGTYEKKPLELAKEKGNHETGAEAPRTGATAGKTQPVMAHAA